MYAWDLNTEVNNKYNKNRPFTQQDITYDYEPQNLDFSKTEDSIPLSETSSEKKTDSIDLSSKEDLQYVELLIISLIIIYLINVGKIVLFKFYII